MTKLAANAQNRIPYLTLDTELEHQIKADQKNGWVNPHRCNDEDILRRENNIHDKATLIRPAFSRDTEKIVNIPAYNRYSDKTQVFSFVENDDICRRSLHVQLVNRVSLGIGKLLGLNTDLIEAIALGHDLGHTPFGHAGEHFLSACYHEHTGRWFNHNVHSVRVLDKLYKRNISLQVLDGVLCHNGEFEQQVLQTGNTKSFEELDTLVEACMADENVIATLRPSTLEGCVVRVSDMIAYLGKDRADALDMGIIGSLDVFDSCVIGTNNARIINNLTVDIISNSYSKDKIMMSEEVFEDLKTAKRQNYEKIYLKEGMVGETKNIVEEMFNEVYECLLRDLITGNENSPVFLHHIKKLVAKSSTITKDSYLTEEPNQIIVDYIASMTDSYFTELYSYLFPNKEKNLMRLGYCSDLPKRQ